MKVNEMYILNKIIKYPKKTIDQSVKDVMKSKNRLISGKYAPVVFNMPYTEISYKSIDGKNLYGWYIKRTDNPKSTVILAHGRENNRIFCLKFLQIFLDIDKEKKYNIFIPDLRNSGKSDESITAFGYFFAKDIYSTINMLKEKQGIKNYILYGFSQGGMGVAACVYFFKNKLKEAQINVEKIILDSPVSNVPEIIAYNAKIFGHKLPKFMLTPSFFALNKIVEKNLSKLKLSHLLGVVPTLIIQSQKDRVTPFCIIKKEYEKLNDSQRNLTRFKAFRKGQHVRIYLEYKEEYTQTINKFLESEKI